MIVGFAEMLDGARRSRTAVGAFTCYDAESAAGVLRAAAGRPVVLLVSARLVTGPGGDLLVAGLRGMAERAPGPACLELDHAHDLDAIRAGCELGFGAVMADGSHLSHDANVELVLAAREVAVPFGIAVEAEVGVVTGDEEAAVPADSGALTDPAEAERFTLAARPDCLAVAIGNVHGLYRGPPRLDLERLRRIAARVDVPLALHGGSGLPDAAVRGAVGAGAAKVNVNTELRQAYIERTVRELPAALDGARLLALHQAQADAVRTVTERKLALMGGGVR
jgi:tagatose 1,6-diphosphate aldolase GatY/KbaY